MVGLALALAACGGKVSATAVEKDGFAKIGRGDVAGALALITDDAVFQIRGCPPEGCKGKAALKGVFEGVAALHPKYTVTTSTDKDNTATSKVEVENDLAKAAGVQRYVVNTTLELKGDKIAKFQAQFDVTDQQTATVVNFLQVSGVATGFITKVDEGDAAGALALVDDSVVVFFSGCPPDGCKGKAAATAALQGQIAQHLKPKILSTKVTGDTAELRVEAYIDAVKAAGVERFLTTLTFQVKGGKVVLVRSANDLTDAQTAKFVNFRQVSGIATGLITKVDEGDLAGALALVDDSAVFAIPGCPPDGCKGKAASTAALQGLIAQHPKHKILSTKVTGDTAELQVEAYIDAVKAAGVDRFLATLTIQIKGGKVVLERAAFDLTDTQTAKFAQFLASQPAPK